MNNPTLAPENSLYKTYFFDSSVDSITYRINSLDRLDDSRHFLYPHKTTFESESVPFLVKSRYLDVSQGYKESKKKYHEFSSTNDRVENCFIMTRLYDWVKVLYGIKHGKLKDYDIRVLAALLECQEKRKFGKKRCPFIYYREVIRLTDLTKEEIRGSFIRLAGEGIISEKTHHPLEDFKDSFPILKTRHDHHALQAIITSIRGKSCPINGSNVFIHRFALRRIARSNFSDGATLLSLYLRRMPNRLFRARITHKAVGDLWGISGKSVQRALSTLKDEGIIQEAKGKNPTNIVKRWGKLYEFCVTWYKGIKEKSMTYKTNVQSIINNNLFTPKDSEGATLKPKNPPIYEDKPVPPERAKEYFKQIRDILGTKLGQTFPPPKREPPPPPPKPVLLEPIVRRTPEEQRLKLLEQLAALKAPCPVWVTAGEKALYDQLMI